MQIYCTNCLINLFLSFEMLNVKCHVLEFQLVTNILEIRNY